MSVTFGTNNLPISAAVSNNRNKTTSFHLSTSPSRFKVSIIYFIDCSSPSRNKPSFLIYQVFLMEQFLEGISSVEAKWYIKPKREEKQIKPFSSNLTLILKKNALPSRKCYFKESANCKNPVYIS